MTTPARLFRLFLTLSLILSFTAHADQPYEPELDRLAARYLRMNPADACGAFTKLQNDERTLIETVHRVARERAIELRDLWLKMPAEAGPGEPKPAQTTAVAELLNHLADDGDLSAWSRTADRMTAVVRGSDSLVSYGAKVHLARLLPSKGLEERLDRLADLLTRSLFAAAEAKAADRTEEVERALLDAGRILVEAYAVTGNVKGSYFENRRHAITLMSNVSHVLVFANLAAAVASIYVEALRPAQGYLIVSQIALFLVPLGVILNEALNRRYDRPLWLKNSAKMKRVNAELVPRLIESFWRDVGDRITREVRTDRVMPNDLLLSERLEAGAEATRDTPEFAKLVRESVKRRVGELSGGATVGAYCEHALATLTPSGS